MEVLEGCSIVATAISLSLSLLRSLSLGRLILERSFALDKRTGTWDRNWEVIGLVCMRSEMVGSQQQDTG